MKVLVIGGSGTFGQRIARLLAAEGEFEILIAGRDLSRAEKVAKSLDARARRPANRRDARCAARASWPGLSDFHRKAAEVPVSVAFEIARRGKPGSAISAATASKAAVPAGSGAKRTFSQSDLVPLSSILTWRSAHTVSKSCSGVEIPRLLPPRDTFYLESLLQRLWKTANSVSM